MSREQDEIDALLLDELESGQYSANEPFVLVDPYGTSPFTALLLFSTEQETKVTLRVEGHSELTSTGFCSEVYEQKHIVPIYGLYPGCTNPVHLSLTAADGTVSEHTYQIEMPALPALLSDETLDVQTFDETMYQPGFQFSYSGNYVRTVKTAFDADGVYRWFLDLSGYPLLNQTALTFSSFNGGNSAFLCFGCNDAENGPAVLLEFSYLGRLLNAYYTPYGLHHEVNVTDETIYVGGSAENAPRETLLCAIDRQNGEVSIVLDYTDILQSDRAITRAGPWRGLPEDDWCHLNSICITKNGNFISSCRNQSTVVCTDADGNLLWLLAEPMGWDAEHTPYLLHPVGDGFRYPEAQHYAYELPDCDGNGDTIDILLFDNGDYLKGTDFSRMVQYRINEKERTVEQVWSYGEDRKELFSDIVGSAKLLENGNRLGNFAVYDIESGETRTVNIEVSPDGEVVWECHRTGNGESSHYADYRIDRFNIYGDGSAECNLGKSA